MRKQNIGILQVLGMECESSTGPLLYCGVPCVIPLALAEKVRGMKKLSQKTCLRGAYCFFGFKEGYVPVSAISAKRVLGMYRRRI